MERTVISAPADLLRKARRQAASEGISLAALVRRALARELGSAPPRPRSFGVYGGGPDDAARTTEEPIEPPPWRSS